MTLEQCASKHACIVNWHTVLLSQDPRSKDVGLCIAIAPCVTVIVATWSCNRRSTSCRHSREVEMLMFRVLATILFSFIGIQAAYADYWGRWDRIGGGWTTGWIRHSGNAYVCGHRHWGCRCGRISYCGNYRNGAVTTWWPRGCGRGRPVWRIRCSIRPIGSPGGAQGANHRFCQRYAQQAINQYRANLARRCGYRGGQGGAGWGANYSSHYNWCRRVSASTANRHTRIRNTMLNRCLRRR